MDRRKRVSWGALGLALLLGGCGDLFHSTDFPDLCQTDAAACTQSEPGSVLDGGAPFPADFCAWDSATARAHALHACAWLGACAGPGGKNAFGTCMVEALLAYDCAANPGRPVLGAAHASWDHLWRASTCADVLAAVEPGTPRAACGASSFDYLACAPSPNTDTLLGCTAGDGGAPSVIDCAASGQTCVSSGAGASCAGSAAACASAMGTFCDGTHLHDCQAGGDSSGPTDVGVDCASFGAGSCASGACLAAGDAGCAASSLVTCEGDVAVGCPSGIAERIDCAQVLGGTASCDPNAPGRAWDVARACSAGACPADSCGGGLKSCARGVPVGVDCAAMGLGACTLVTVAGDATPHAACSAP
ncbi:MAG TPA: hypothetical protein VGI39_40275 [Polyangiaceae bacterium]|jgi:hypothetical protein